MTSHQKYLSLCLLMIVALLYGLSPALAQTLDDFAVLGGAAVTCTDSIVNGDVGVANSPGIITETRCTINGTRQQGNAAARQAYADFLAEYAALATQPPCTASEVPLSGATLTPGVYCYAAAVTATGTLTLNGPCDGTWIFRIGTSGTGALTTTDFTVVHPGCNACDSNVVWRIAQAATLTNSTLIGSILAGADITVTGAAANPAIVDGQVLAGGSGTTTVRTGAVTLTDAMITACEVTGGGPGGGGNENNGCNQGRGNGPEDCDPGNSNNNQTSNDELGQIPGQPGRR